MDPNDLIEILNRAINYHLQEINICLPAQIVDFDHSTLKASVKVMIKRKIDTETSIEYPTFTNVPVQFPSGGGFQISFPLKNGDKGRIIVFQSSIDNYISGNGGIVDPKDQRRFSLNDIAFIPGVNPYSQAISADPEKLIIQNKEKTGFISMTSGGKIEIESTGEMEIKANVTIDGNLTVTGNATIDNISFNSHLHSGVQTGASNSGPPVP